ncbi:hypothetical protein L2E82_06801 [Cichorium intybus]|uniref:Uncharacterized protein n=1 Tax=Cichorium intybus TaxID=13427 RepID=A0ACB9HAJ2_CICIN|nr:hypothetical protein L2E82_06801 [Cichorium intybus]
MCMLPPMEVCRGCSLESFLLQAPVPFDFFSEAQKARYLLQKLVDSFCGGIDFHQTHLGISGKLRLVESMLLLNGVTAIW